MIDIVGEACYGCAACYDICPQNAITFATNKEGFGFPQIQAEVCTQCDVCEKACPVLGHKQGHTIQKSYASFAKHKETSQQSSSGGMFYVLADKVIVEGGAVYGAAFNVELKLNHVRVTEVDQLYRLCGSKYIQSELINVHEQVREDLRAGLRVLFSGTPCQVAGLRNFLRREYDNLILIDLICHGVPSPGLFEDYLKFVNKLKNKKVTGFITRDNRDGWDDKFRSTLIFDDGKEEYNSMLSNLWNRLYFSELATRKSCEECQFANMNRQGDITIGDFWGIQNVDKNMYNREGVSLILLNTDKGQAAYDSIKYLIQFNEAYTSENEHPNLYHP